MRSQYKTLVLWVFLMVGFVAVYRLAGDPPPTSPISWTGLEEAAELDGVERVDVTIRNGEATGLVRMRDGGRFTTGAQPMGRFSSLQTRGVAVFFKQDDFSLWSVLAQWVPMVLLLVFFLYFMRAFASKKGTDVLKFEPLVAVVAQPVALRGLASAKEKLVSAAKAAQAGTPGPRRVLITGAPGTGKTSLLKAVAHETQVPLLALPGSEFVEIFVGVGAARVRKVFETATASQPCIVAIDDVDAFATPRALPDQKGLVDERAATLLELNNRLEGLTPMPPKVLFLATTSRPELLDEALARRFDLTLTLLANGECTIDGPRPAGV